MGTQYYDDASYPTSSITIFFGSGLQIDKTYQPSSPGSIGTATYDVNDTFDITRKIILIDCVSPSVMFVIPVYLDVKVIQHLVTV
jgi:hypothetical protein